MPTICLSISGIIPAYAGNTRSGRNSCAVLEDHPRVCGEHHRSCVSIVVYGGSSPAYAGNTFRLSRVVVWRGDHPRVCGEHFTLHPAGSNPQGSSPRMRGTPVRESHEFDIAGIIPAYAGNTSRSMVKMASVWDHPRVCGEHERHPRRTGIDEGSSPRMRGTPKHPPMT